mmetsp:Transcript_24356/g.39810  ORF Transcript_24356/g.39810 Transcript_24356/m.39810 type:complete len:460 (+) Transcript_24356:174-1553(+)
MNKRPMNRPSLTTMSPTTVTSPVLGNQPSEGAAAQGSSSSSSMHNFLESLLEKHEIVNIVNDNAVLAMDKETRIEASTSFLIHNNDHNMKPCRWSSTPDVLGPGARRHSSGLAAVTGNRYTTTTTSISSGRTTGRNNASWDNASAVVSSASPPSKPSKSSRNRNTALDPLRQSDHGSLTSTTATSMSASSSVPVLSKLPPKVPERLQSPGDGLTRKPIRVDLSQNVMMLTPSLLSNESSSTSTTKTSAGLSSKNNNSSNSSNVRLRNALGSMAPTSSSNRTSQSSSKSKSSSSSSSSRSSRHHGNSNNKNRNRNNNRRHSIAVTNNNQYHKAKTADLSPPRRYSCVAKLVSDGDCTAGSSLLEEQQQQQPPISCSAAPTSTTTTTSSVPRSIRDFTVPNGTDHSDLSSLCQNGQNNRNRDRAPLPPPSRRERSSSWEERTDQAIALATTMTTTTGQHEE